MYDINTCYKIIFEAIAGDKALSDVAEQIHRYADCGIAFMTGTGRILAAAGFSGEGKPSFRFYRKNHMLWEDYEAFFVKKYAEGNILYTEPICDKKKVTGYVLFAYEGGEKTDFIYELGEFLAQICTKYYMKVQERYIYNQSVRKHIRAWTMMEEGFDFVRIREGKYVAALFLKRENSLSELASFLRESCDLAYVYENEQEVRILFYRLTGRTAEKLYRKMEKKQLCGCVSEPFSDRHFCRAKQHLLRQISRTEGFPQGGSIKRENEWFVSGIYTYAVPLIEEAGLTDYGMQKLLREDKEKNTNLYHTLKTYLLCENNITMAARKLHIHRNTLVYRMKQIENCLGIDFDDSESSWNLLALIMMYDMVKLKQETEANQ